VLCKIKSFFKLAFESCKSGFGFQQKFSFVQVRSFSSGYFPNFIGLKICSCFCFKKFCFKLAQVSKIGFKIFAQVLASKRFYLAKSIFSAYVLVVQIRFSKSASLFQQKFRQVWLGLFAMLIFSGKFVF